MATEPDADWVDTVADGEDVLTGEAVSLDLRPASFALRAGGAIIDFVVSAIAYVVILLAFFIPAGNLGFEAAWGTFFSIASLVLAFVVLPCLVETLSHGKSLGRLAVGARIVRDDGAAAGLRHAAIRAFAGVLDFLLTLGGLAALVGLLSPRSKRLGDHLAGTYSQYERAPQVATPVFGMPLELTGWAQVADVARMPDPLARRIANFLASARELDPNRRGYLAQQLAFEASQYVSPLPAVDPELFLAGVTVARRDREARALRLEAERLALLEPVLEGGSRPVGA